MLAPGLNKATVMSTRAPLTRERHTAKVVWCAALSFLMSGKKCCMYCFARPAGYLHFGFKMLCFHGVFLFF